MNYKLVKFISDLHARKEKFKTLFFLRPGGTTVRTMCSGVCSITAVRSGCQQLGNDQSQSKRVTSHYTLIKIKYQPIRARESIDHFNWRLKRVEEERGGRDAMTIYQSWVRARPRAQSLSESVSLRSRKHKLNGAQRLIFFFNGGLHSELTPAVLTCCPTLWFLQRLRPGGSGWVRTLGRPTLSFFFSVK